MSHREFARLEQSHPQAARLHNKDDDALPGHFRKDIEGLRAIAVILVVLDHLVSWPRGGFIGVDVFFVISGFLITGLLLNESERKGRLSIRSFYARRARRILPAALTVLLAVVIIAPLTFRGIRVKETFTDAWWALGFSANYHFANIGTDYFEANRPPSLVQHFWSLAVEEQFYLIWPIAMLLVLTLIGRRLSAVAAKTVLLAVVGAATVALFVWAIQQTTHFPAAAYFSTPVRAWELGTGAIVAVAAARFPGLPKSLGTKRGPLSAIGLASIIASAFVVNANSGFPAPTAAIPVLGSALVIFSGIGAPLRGWTSPLTNRVTTYIGRVSFSLYLWHWPVIIIVGILIPKSATVYYPLVLTSMAALTVVSYHFIESPVRHAKFAKMLSRLNSTGWRHSLSRPQLSAAKRRPALASALLACAALSAYTLKPMPASMNVGAGRVAAATPRSDRYVVQPPASLSQAMVTAAGATSWPDLNPSLDHLGINSAFAQWKGCRGATETTLSGCTFGETGGAQRVAVVLGDSFAMAWLPAIRAALVPQHWVVYGLTKDQCPAAFVSVFNQQRPPTYFSECDSRHTWMISETERLKPSLVILASAPTLPRLATRATDSAAEAEWRRGMERTINAIQATGKPRVLTLSPPPGAPSLQSCVTAVATPKSCLGGVSAEWRTMRTAEAGAATATATAYADTHLWFCTADLRCPSFVGSTPVRWDGGHLTSAYASGLGPEMARVIASALE